MSKAKEAAFTKAVRDRDKNMCRKCGNWSDFPHAHHIKPRSRFPELKYDVDNGVCLDVKCHIYVHNHPKEAHKAGLLYVGKYD